MVGFQRRTSSTLSPGVTDLKTDDVLSGIERAGNCSICYRYFALSRESVILEYLKRSLLRKDNVSQKDIGYYNSSSYDQPDYYPSL